jgi:hypothetical protein
MAVKTFRQFRRFVTNKEEKQMQQIVYLGKTRTGVFGYFTNGYLAWSLSPEQYARGDEWHADYAKSLNFHFVSSVEA